MCVCRKEYFDDVCFLCCESDHAFTTAALHPKHLWILSFYISIARHHNNRFFFWDKVFLREITHSVRNDFGAPTIAKVFFDPPFFVFFFSPPRRFEINRVLLFFIKRRVCFYFWIVFFFFLGTGGRSKKT